MKTVSMSGSLREGVGKKDAKVLRSEGRIPCVLYGGKEQIKFTADEKDFHQIVFTPDSYFIKLTIDGKNHDCVLKDIQYHPVSDTILHADFIEFEMNKPLTMSVPVKFTGNAPGLIKGGQLVKKFRKLNIRALPGDMPESVVIDISNLDIDQKITIGELAQDKFKILEKPERYIIAIRATRVSATTEPGAEGAAPPAK
jgi:large subunit ribosomal protein L25